MEHCATKRIITLLAGALLLFGGAWQGNAHPSSADEGERVVSRLRTSVEPPGDLHRRPLFLREEASVTADLHVVEDVSSLDSVQFQSLDAPRPTAPAPAAILDASEPVVLEWEAVPDAETYTVEVSPSERFPSARTDTLQSEATAYELAGLAPSTSYHWRVRAEGAQDSSAWSDERSFLVYPATVDVKATRSLDSSDVDSGYRLVGLPGRDTSSLAQTVEGDAGSDWQAFRETGAQEKSLVPFEPSSPLQFHAGNGFWLRSDKEWRVDASRATVPLEDDGTYSIELHDGWNVISNPFDLDVSWSAVEAANNRPLPPLWRFSGAFEAASTFASARSGEAFYLLNDQGLDALRIPYPAFPRAPEGTAAEKEEDAPTMTLSTYWDQAPTSHIRVGVDENAEDGWDAYDQVAPPDRFVRSSLRVRGEDEDAPSRQRHLMADYRSVEGEGHTFVLDLRAKPDAPVDIRAEGVDAFEGQQVVLVDPSTGESYDLRTRPRVTLRPDADSQSLQLLVGSTEYVEKKKEATLPDGLQFMPPYPNPFSDQTTFEYVLPNSSSVRLAVYDVLGRQVRVLVDERQTTGRHTVQWNGRDERGSRMASGVYLVRLLVDGSTKVRKVTFVQ